ncbi:sirohydrochlorin chelatase [Serpentinimonas barnesii]|uniref:sirohydrochlorin chelatase n=1 Tax=Serpentinimonas barnesii TaxID=1458427 RepID=UPI000496C617|nr:CbiX/SirB N-terminal domain-containing protein [Serpentinimonas barnesii]
MLGVIVLAHGSRDPQWFGPIEAVAQAVAARAPQSPVRCAYLELCGPSLPEAAAELVAAGATTLRVLPLFFGLGKHARQDLPLLAEELQQSHPAVRFEWLPTPTEQPRLLALLAELAVAESPP